MSSLNSFPLIFTLRFRKGHIIILSVLFTSYFLLVGCEYEKNDKADNFSYNLCTATQDSSKFNSALPPGSEECFLIPTVDKDKYGNPVGTRSNSRFDQVTGYAYEIWFKKPCIEYVLIPPGEFMMGSNTNDTMSRDDEFPIHRVEFSMPFYIGKYEITQGQWETMMGSNPSFSIEAGKNAPIENVSFEDCQTFINKLNNLLKDTIADDNSRKIKILFALPSESEWEYACRAGSRTVYNTCDSHWDLDPVCWYCLNSEGTSHIVGKKTPNPWGLYDMHGNVWEWCGNDYRENYSSLSKDSNNLRGSLNSETKAIRGGAWVSHPRDCRSAARSCSLTREVSPYLGFRLVIKILP